VLVQGDKMIPKRRKKRYGSRKSGSKTLRKMAVVKLPKKIAFKVHRALKRVGIPSIIKKIGRKRYLDLRPPRTSTKEIIRKNIALRRMIGK